MGITPEIAEIILKEHNYRKLPDEVFLLGRQTVSFNLETAYMLFKKHGITPVETYVEIDNTTVGAKESDKNFITDKTFFKLLGVKKVYAIDHSDYEGAEIIVDLNYPISDDYVNFAEFIYGGSVLDNLFDPAMYIKNMSKILKPGGRLLEGNVLSLYPHPYLVASPAWYYDFFVVNGYKDCKIYILEANYLYGTYNVYGLGGDLNGDFISDFGESYGCGLGIVVIAEKSENSTWYKVSNQDCYRSKEDWSIYRRNQEKVLNSPRPYWTFCSPLAHQWTAQPPRVSRSYKYLGILDPTSPDDFNEEDIRNYLESKEETGIRIIEATYGFNNFSKKLVSPAFMPICTGNVTRQIRYICNGRNQVDFTVDVSILGDPAPGMVKDLTIEYYYAQDPERRVHTIYVPPEAHGRKVKIKRFKPGKWTISWESITKRLRRTSKRS